MEYCWKTLKHIRDLNTRFHRCDSRNNTSCGSNTIIIGEASEKLNKKQQSLPDLDLENYTRKGDGETVSLI
jgi:hypothetical protein